MKLTLGTAQFGTNYGISNNLGKVKKKEITKILHFCLKYNVKELDTARSYGDAEKRLGSFRNVNKFIINTKISNMKNIKQQIYNSLENLKIKQINICYIHNFVDIKNLSKGKKIFNELNDLKNQKKIKQIGISLYYVKDLIYCIKNYKFDVIQVPINIFNQDFCDNKVLNLIDKYNIKIIARSVFLQGLFFMKINNLDVKFKPLKNKLTILKKKFASKSEIISYCLNFLKQKKIIYKVIIATTSLNELKEIIKLYKDKKRYGGYHLFKTKSKMRNPSNW